MAARAPWPVLANRRLSKDCITREPENALSHGLPKGLKQDTFRVIPQVGCTWRLYVAQPAVSDRTYFGPNSEPGRWSNNFKCAAGAGRCSRHHHPRQYPARGRGCSRDRQEGPTGNRLEARRLHARRKWQEAEGFRVRSAGHSQPRRCGACAYASWRFFQPSRKCESRWDSDCAASGCSELLVHEPGLRAFADVEVCPRTIAIWPSNGRVDADGSIACAAGVHERSAGADHSHQEFQARGSDSASGSTTARYPFRE